MCSKDNNVYPNVLTKDFPVCCNNSSNMSSLINKQMIAITFYRKILFWHKEKKY